MPLTMESMEIDARAVAVPKSPFGRPQPEPSQSVRKAGAIFLASAACVALVYGGHSVGEQSAPVAATSLVASVHRPQLVGGTLGEHDCLSTAGYTWCPSLETCVRGWSDSCPGGTAACQALCEVEPDVDVELEACQGDHATWTQHAVLGNGTQSAELGNGEGLHTCSSYDLENKEGCAEDVDSEGIVASSACPQCQQCSVVKGRTCLCGVGGALDFAPPAHIV